MKFSGTLNGRTAFFTASIARSMDSSDQCLRFFLHVGTTKKPTSSYLSFTPHVLSSIPEPKIARMVVNGRHCKLYTSAYLHKRRDSVERQPGHHHAAFVGRMNRVPP